MPPGSRKSNAWRLRAPIQVFWFLALAARRHSTAKMPSVQSPAGRWDSRRAGEQGIVGSTGAAGLRERVPPGQQRAPRRPRPPSRARTRGGVHAAKHLGRGDGLGVHAPHHVLGAQLRQRRRQAVDDGGLAGARGAHHHDAVPHLHAAGGGGVVWWGTGLRGRAGRQGTLPPRQLLPLPRSALAAPQLPSHQPALQPARPPTHQVRLVQLDALVQPGRVRLQAALRHHLRRSGRRGRVEKERGRR